MGKIWGGSPRADRARRLGNSCLKLATDLDRHGHNLDADKVRAAAALLNAVARQLER